MMSQRITSSRPCFVARTCVNHDLRRGKKCVCRMSQSNTPSQVDRCKPMQWLAGSAAALVLGSCCLSPGQALADFSSADTSSAIIQIVTGVNTVNAEENEVIRRESEAAQAENDVFLEIKVDGKPQGRVVVHLFGDVPVGSQRFLELCKGIEGVSYRQSRFDGISEAFIRNGGLNRLSFSSSNITPITGGDTVEQLEAEMELRRHSHDSAGVVSLVVQGDRERVTRDKLVAYSGKLVTVQETVLGGDVPNGSGFIITLQPNPELDDKNLVVGRVTEGLDVVKEIAALPAVKDNTDSPFFKVAKAVGDKRVIVAEQGFGRPFARVVVSGSGVIEKPSNQAN